MTLLRTIGDFFSRTCWTTPGDAVVIAVSGGRDSVVLLHAMNVAAASLQLQLEVAHVNHSLRGAEADEDEAFVAELAGSLSIPFSSRRVDVRSHAEQKRLSIQAAARELRYDALENIRIASAAQWIATAHHRQDNAETLLLHMLRGAGIDGLQGIRPVNGAIIRPMLDCSSEEIARYATEHSLRWREDSSNEDLHYTRNALRRDVMPVIASCINPSVERTLSESAATFRSLAEFIRHRTDALAATAIEQRADGVYLVIPAMIGYLEFEQIALIRRAFFLCFGFEASHADTSAIARLTTSQSGTTIHVRGGGAVARDRDSLAFFLVPEGPLPTIRFHTGESAIFGNQILRVRKVPRDAFRANTDRCLEYVDATACGVDWIVRAWCDGDSFFPLGAAGEQKLSDYFVNMKVPRWEKTTIPILESNGEIVWVCGMRLDDRCKITEATTDILELTMRKITDE